MNYSLDAGAWNSVFAVPAAVVDKYIKLAGENSLKLLLYLLRHGGKSVPDEKLRRDLGFSEKGELEDAALFWIQRGVLRFEKGFGEEIALAAEKQENTAPKAVIEEAAPFGTAEKEIKKPAPAVVTSGDIAERINSDPEIKMLFSEAEKLYGHPLKTREVSTIISLPDHYGLGVGVSLMLLQYCFKTEKASPAYIFAAAEDWANEGIDTVELANKKILALEKRNGVSQRIREAMELKTKFTPKMSEYIRVWTEEWGFSEEMIMLAYDKTVDSTGEFKFSYANKILENWKSAGISTKAAALKADEERKKPVKAAAKGASADSSFDIDDIFKKARNRKSGG